MDTLNRTSILLRRMPQYIPIAGQILWGRLSNLWARNKSDGTSAPPEIITVMVTDACNLRCVMCHYSFTKSIDYQLRQTGSMPEEIFQKLVDEVPGNPLVSLTGGEPLLHPKISAFIAYVKAKGRVCILTTNGWMLAQKAEEIADVGLDFLCISVDGPAEVHNSIRGDRSYERLSEGLETIMRLPNRPIVIITTSVSNLNYDKLPVMYELAKKWKVDGLNVNHLWMQTEKMVKDFNTRFALYFKADEVDWAIHPELINVHQLAESFDWIERTNHRGNMIITRTPPLNQEEIAVWYQNPEKFVKWKTTRCAWSRLKIFPDGAVKPCRGWKVGNIKETHVMEIWNGEDYRRFRKLLAKRGVLPICARCCLMAYR